MLNFRVQITTCQNNFNSGVHSPHFAKHLIACLFGKSNVQEYRVYFSRLTVNDGAQQSAGILALFTFGNITCLRFDVVDVDGMLISHFILHGTIPIYHTQSTEEFIHASNDIMEV